MSRSGFLLSITGPAALLTVLVQPTLQEPSAPRAMDVPVAMASQAALPGQRIASTALSPARTASITRPENRANSALNGQGRTASEREQPKARRFMREGCEGAISSLAGPEARRMLPGRCIS